MTEGVKFTLNAGWLQSATKLLRPIAVLSNKESFGTACRGAIGFLKANNEQIALYAESFEYSCLFAEDVASVAANIPDVEQYSVSSWDDHLFWVNGEHFTELVQSFSPLDDVSIERKEECAIVACKSTRVEMPLLFTEKPPAYLNAKLAHTCSIDVATSRFIEVLGAVKDAMPKKDPMKVLNGIFLEAFPEDQTLKATATDAKILANKSIFLCQDQFHGDSVSASFILPASIVQALSSSLKPYLRVKLQFCDKVLVVTADNAAAFTIRSVGGDYPNYRAILDKKWPITVYIERKELFGALKRAVSLGTYRSTGRCIVDFTFSPGESRVEADGYENMFSERIMANVSRDATVSFDAKVIMGAIKNFSNGSIELGVIDAKSPVKVTKQHDNSLVYIVMPVFKHVNQTEV